MLATSEGGFFKAHLDFPKDYPQHPPVMQFVTKIYHPNGMSLTFTLFVFRTVINCNVTVRLTLVYDYNSNFLTVDKDGKVCISILHEPGEDKFGYEKSSERWRPIHTVETILLSVISMLADPNDESPANIDAAVSSLLYYNIVPVDIYIHLF